MSDLVDVIAIVPRNFDEIVEKTKHSVTPFDRQKLGQVYNSNRIKGRTSYVLIQTIVQYYEEVGNEETGSVEPATPVLESVQDPEEPSTKAREGRPPGGIPRGF